MFGTRCCGGVARLIATAVCVAWGCVAGFLLLFSARYGELLIGFSGTFRNMVYELTVGFTDTASNTL
jgi:hypothetical protein